MERVETMVEGPVANISCVDQAEVAVELEPVQTWDPSRPLILDGAPCLVIHAEPEKIWLAELPDTVKINGRVTQPTLVGCS